MELTDAPGMLAKLSKALADAKVNIDYAYSTTVGVGQPTRLIMKLTPLEAACKALDGV